MNARRWGAGFSWLSGELWRVRAACFIGPYERLPALRAGSGLFLAECLGGLNREAASRRDDRGEQADRGHQRRDQWQHD